VWRRGARDIWLIAGTDEKSWLFNNAGGQSATPLPTEAERAKLAEAMTAATEHCARPFVDLLALTPFQGGDDVAVALSPARARRMLKALLARRPDLAKLSFVRHGCYGEDCIGATVSSSEEAAELRSALDAGEFARHNVRCEPPPKGERFAIDPWL
jgi:hypothetical protein